MSCPCENENLIPFYNECASTTPVEITGCVTTPDTSCITYNGSALSCLGLPTGTALNAVLTAIDTKLCTISGDGGDSVDWVTFNTACLGTVYGEENTIVTLQAFVETISAQYCATKATVASQASTSSGHTTQINSILNPTISGCSYLGGSTAYDTYAEAMQLYATKLCNLDSRLSMLGVNWQSCFTGASTPTSIADAFSALLSQICSVKATADSANTAASGADKYVRTSALDPTSSYLSDKIVFNSCFTVSEGTGSAGKVLNVSLANKGKAYTFNSAQFDTSSPSSTACTDTYTVSVKSSFIDSLTTTINCASISALYPNADSPVVSLSGKDSSSCASFDSCRTLEFLASGLSTGKYVVEVDTTQTDTCDRYKLVPETGGSTMSNSCTALGWVPLNTVMSTGGPTTNILVNWVAGAGYTNSVAYSSLVTTFPQYRWTGGGNLNFKGAIRTSFAGAAGTGAGHSYSYDITLGTVSNPCSNPINSQESFVMYQMAPDLLSPGTFIGSISALLSIDELGVLKVRVYVNIDASNHDYTIIIPLSGVTFYF